MIHVNRPLHILLAVLILALFALPATAQDDAVTGNGDTGGVSITDDEVNEIARDVYCPVCENTPLDVCQTKACADWRELIRTKLAEGQSNEEIFDYFARQYGDGVLANPPRRGVSLVMLWVLPVVLILLGVLLFGRYMRSLRSTEVEAVPAAPQDPKVDVPSKTAGPGRDDYLARVEEELNKTDE